MCKKIGYARVSTSDQNLDVQRAALDAAGCDVILEEKVSGTKRDGRERLDIALKLLGAGDMLIVTRLDRLGRSLRDLANLAHEIETKGAALQVIEQSVDTSSSAGRAFFGMLATFAAFETDVRSERQREGILRAKVNGERREDGALKYAGRSPSVDAEAVRAALATGERPAAIAKRLGVSRQSIWRAGR